MIADRMPLWAFMAISSYAVLYDDMLPDEEDEDILSSYFLDDPDDGDEDEMEDLIEDDDPAWYSNMIY